MSKTKVTEINIKSESGSEGADSNSRRPVDHGILVVDYGSQYTMLILRRLRALGVYAELVDASVAAPPPGFKAFGIILSGGPDSVGDDTARVIPTWVLSCKLPVLGICYGLQLLVKHFGGEVRSGQAREYGRATITVSAEIAEKAGQIFFDQPTQQTVWMSHGDDVLFVGDQMKIVAQTGEGVCAAAIHRTLPICGLQYHPEVEHTEFGTTLLTNFVRSICRAPVDWTPQDMYASSVNHIKQIVGPTGKVLMAVSGGVDSTVAAVLLKHALGEDRVIFVFVDHGLLRKNEREWVEENFRFLGIRNLVTLDASEVFLSRLAGIIDPEQKRKIIGKTFIDEFQKFAAKQANITHLGQGTLYPDVIESAGHGSGSKLIKSHHNVGGLPETLALQLVEPFRFMFKDEVRALGREMGINLNMLDRHPFPGPGLAIRMLGAVDKDGLEILREADSVFIQALRDSGFYSSTWQAFCVLLPIKSVGVMGDNRTYERTCVLRAVSASDGMTADVTEFPFSFLLEVSRSIVQRVKGINRVVYDLTSKPPATIEWE